MPDSKRQCATCQFFQSAQLAGNGWCTHPKRQGATDVKILVREKELACRNSWGDDLWDDSASRATTLEQAPEPPRSLIVTNKRVDDEVTSVIDTAARSADLATHGDGDDVITHTAVRTESALPARNAVGRQPNDLNTPANADQDERVRLMARGNRDAVSGARERLVKRRAPREADTPAEPPTDQVLTALDRDQYAASRSGASSTDEYAATPPVPRAEVEARQAALSPASGTDSRFDTVPNVKPEVDLPRLRTFLGTGNAPASTGNQATGPTSTFDMVLQRAQEIKAEAGRNRAHRAKEQAVHPAPPALPADAPLQDPEPAPVGPQVTAGSPASADSTPETVVLDVQGDLLEVAFARARSAIVPPTAVDRLISTSTSPRPSPPPTSGRSTDARRVTSPRPSPARPVPVMTEAESLDTAIDEFEDVPWEMTSTGPTTTSLALGDTHAAVDDAQRDGATRNEAFLADDQEGAYDDLAAFEGDVADGAYLRQPESPRLNWWRGLSFRRKRHQDPDYDDNAWFDAQTTTSDTYPVDQGEPYAEPWDDAWDTPVDEPEYVAAPEPGPLLAPASRPGHVTSEASWQEDIRAFPEPQPVAWHEERSRLLSTRIPLEPLVLPDARLEAVAAEYGDALPPSPPVRDPAPYFAIDEPDGMDAFRSALFRSEPSPAAVAQSSHGDPVMVAAPDDDDDRLVETSPVYATPARPRRESRPPVTEYAPRSRPAPEVTHGFDPDFDIRDAVRDQDDMVQRHFTVAANISKTCSTCRSFAPDSDGRRGWCTNDWASTHRQMVNGDELACRSTIGDWWLAADTTWIPPVDRIQPETPRTDRLNQRIEAQADSSESHGRRVRTSKVV